MARRKPRKIYRRTFKEANLILRAEIKKMVALAREIVKTDEE